MTKNNYLLVEVVEIKKALKRFTPELLHIYYNEEFGDYVVNFNTLSSNEKLKLKKIVDKIKIETFGKEFLK